MINQFNIGDIIKYYNELYIIAEKIKREDYYEEWDVNEIQYKENISRHKIINLKTKNIWIMYEQEGEILLVISQSQYNNTIRNNRRFNKLFI